ncbi:hypothetical protein [Burkholderia multivorans]|uniref:hypothetical protein n=1 Tax=Burkholderia multivorans TaxID=87883 RepID=UPI0015E2F5F4|nr:hypothetical protein [Burkholderia multivorans]
MALINSIGALAGFVGPFFIGFIKDQTGSYGPSFVLMAGFLVIEAVIGFYFGRRIFPPLTRARVHTAPV